jgi:hypothetical protein
MPASGFARPSPYLRRTPYRRPRRRVWAAVRRVPPPLLIIIGVVGLSFLITMVTAALGMAMLIGMIMVPLLIARGITRSARRGRRHHQLAGPHPHVAHPQMVAPPRPAVDPWRYAKSRFAALRSEYAAYECDAIAVLRLPALADVTVPSTARFVEAFAEAQALDVDGAPPQPHRDQYIAAVERAWRAWQAAREAAERIRLSHLPEDERSTVERVVRMLTTARDTDNDAERLVAYGKARSELARLERTGHIRIPRPAQAQLDNAYRGQLPA